MKSPKPFQFLLAAWLGGWFVLTMKMIGQVVPYDPSPVHWTLPFIVIVALAPGVFLGYEVGKRSVK